MQEVIPQDVRFWSKADVTTISKKEIDFCTLLYPKKGEWGLFLRENPRG